MICGHLEQDFFFFISMLFTLYIYMLIVQASDFIVWPQRKYVSILVGCNFLFNIIKCGFVIILRYYYPYHPNFQRREARLCQRCLKLLKILFFSYLLFLLNLKSTVNALIGTLFIFYRNF